MVGSVLNTVPKVEVQDASMTIDDESLFCVSRKDKVLAAIKQVRSGRAPGGGIITAALLKLGER